MVLGLIYQLPAEAVLVDQPGVEELRQVEGKR